jgi:hypothetical protein
MSLASNNNFMINTQWALCEDPLNRGVDDAHFATPCVPAVLPLFFEMLQRDFEA